MFKALFAAAFGVLLLQAMPEPVPVAAGTETFTQRIVASQLENPWEVVAADDQSLWVTERTGKRITRVDLATGEKSTLATFEDVFQDAGQDGVLGLAISRRAGVIDGAFVSLTYDAPPKVGQNRRLAIRHLDYQAATHQLVNPRTVIDGLPAEYDHAGGRLALGPDGRLYLTVGDQASNHATFPCRLNRAQDLPTQEDVAAKRWDSYVGKVLRIDVDGSVPADNPVIRGIRSHVFSYGHRNPQGLMFGPSGRLYESEHGPNTDDELNLIQAGKNYGWPFVAGYRDDRSYVYANWSASVQPPCSALKFDPLVAPASVPQQKETAWLASDFAPPLQTFFTVDSAEKLPNRSATIAASGIEAYAVVAGIPGWSTSILVTSLSRGFVLRQKLSEDGRQAVGAPFAYFAMNTRARDVAVSRDGRTVFVATDRDGSKEHAGEIVAFTYAR